MNIKAMANTTLVKIQKASPEILIVTGVGLVITGTVMACKATRKVDTILEEHKEGIEKIDKAMDLYADDAVYSEQDRNKDLAITYVQTGWKLTKLYGPAVIVEGLGIACMVGSHVILKKRNVALIAAFNVLKNEFDDYRSAVVEELGEEKDRYFRAQRKCDRVAKDDEPTEKAKDDRKNPPAGRYTRYFDETAREWRKNADYNKAFLVCQQNAANNRLRAKGLLFLNEVYELLGFDPTPEGAVVGWVYKTGEDNFVDFGIYKDNDEGSRLFVNGFERSVLLDFNVQGIVFDML